MPFVAFYCAHGPEIGLGHVRRGAAVARALAQLGCQVQVFAEQPEELESHFPTFPCQPWSQAWAQPPLAWVVDALTLPEPLVQLLQQGSLKVSLCPALDCLKAMDLGFHRGAASELAQQATIMHCGLEWAVLPSVQSSPPRAVKVLEALLNQPRWTVGVTLGGGDNLTLLASVLQGLRRAPEWLDLLVVSGIYSQVHQQVVKLTSTLEERQVQTVALAAGEDLWSRLEGCALVITRPGLTPFEAVYHGIPPVILPGGVGFPQALLRQNLALSSTPENLASRIESLRAQPQTLVAMATAGQATLDGGGASRVAGVIVELLKKQSGNLE